MESLKEEKSPEIGSAEELNALKPRIDEEFETYRESYLTDMRAAHEDVVNAGKITSKQSRLALEKKVNELSVQDPVLRVEELVNNLHMLFPGHFYREQILEEKPEDDADRKRISANTQLIKDLDDVIRELGYDSVARSIATRSGVDKVTRATILARVYFAMRDKGYSRPLLAR